MMDLQQNHWSAETVAFTSADSAMDTSAETVAEAGEHQSGLPLQLEIQLMIQGSRHDSSCV